MKIRTDPRLVVNALPKRAPSTSPISRGGDLETRIIGVALWGQSKDWNGLVRCGFDPGLLMVDRHRDVWEVVGPAMKLDMPAIAIHVLSVWETGLASHFNRFFGSDDRVSRMDVHEWAELAKRAPPSRHAPKVPPEILKLLHDLLHHVTSQTTPIRDASATRRRAHAEDRHLASGEGDRRTHGADLVEVRAV